VVAVIMWDAWEDISGGRPRQQQPLPGRCIIGRPGSVLHTPGSLSHTPPTVTRWPLLLLQSQVDPPGSM